MADELELELSYEDDGGNDDASGEEVDYGVSEDEAPSRPAELRDEHPKESKNGDKRKVSSEAHLALQYATFILENCKRVKLSYRLLLSGLLLAGL